MHVENKCKIYKICDIFFLSIKGVKLYWNLISMYGIVFSKWPLFIHIQFYLDNVLGETVESFSACVYSWIHQDEVDIK